MKDHALDAMRYAVWDKLADQNAWFLADKKKVMYGGNRSGKSTVSARYGMGIADWRQAFGGEVGDPIEEKADQPPRPPKDELRVQIDRAVEVLK